MNPSGSTGAMLRQAEMAPAIFHLYAAQYYECMRAFKSEAEVGPVPFFLVCRAIELELMAKHLKANPPAGRKSKYGHNLKKAYDDLDAALAWGRKVVDAIQHPIEIRPFRATGRVQA